MKITEHFLTKWDLLSGYFTKNTFKDWQKKYDKKTNEFDHDEPWLTLVATYSIFGKQDILDKNHHRIDAFNSLLQSCGLKNCPILESIEEIQFEKQLPEILSFRAMMASSAFHFFPDINKKIVRKKAKFKASFEGPTHVDIYIQGKSGGKTIAFFIEAKFNSDISHDIRYNPARDQIARNIDAAIEYQNDKVKDKNIDDFYFLLLTPKIFRTDKFGGNRKTSIEMFQPNKSRLYCYKMDEYKDFRNLRLALPHRVEISEQKWKHISGNIGWLTFEDMIKTAQHYGTIDVGAKIMLENFMNERNMIEK